MTMILTCEQIHEYWTVDLQHGRLYYKAGQCLPRLVGKLAQSFNTATGYWITRKKIDGKQYGWWTHQLIWVAAGNSWPETGEPIYHLNGDNSDNRIVNLGPRSVHYRDYRTMTMDSENKLRIARRKVTARSTLEKEFRIRERVRQKDEYMRRLKEKHGID